MNQIVSLYYVKYYLKYEKLLMKNSETVLLMIFLLTPSRFKNVLKIISDLIVI